MLLIEFASQNFEELHIISPWRSRALADALAERAYQYLMPFIEARLRCIVNTLNNLGHTLNISEKKYDSIEYCSDLDEDGYCNGLMIIGDLHISTGYADTRPYEEVDEFPDERQLWETLINPEIVNSYTEVIPNSTNVDNNELQNFLLQNILLADDIKCKELLMQLETWINQQLHNEVLEGIIELTKELNKEGHNLQIYGEISIGDIAFRDDFEDESGYSCKLRLGVDLNTFVNFRKRS